MNWHDGLHPELKDKVTRLLHCCAEHSQLGKAGLSVVITEGRRDDLTQARYFCQGRTPSEIAAELDAVDADQRTREMMFRAIAEIFGLNALPEMRAPGRIITHALPYSGPHCLGVAVHFVIKRGPRVLYPEAPWEIVGGIAQSRIGLVWGGAWKMRDLAHLELHRTRWPKPTTQEAA
ncbi:hypothetical protein [Candidatus Nitrospira bockiana]